MPPALSLADVERLRVAFATLSAPFDHQSTEAWRTACRAAVEPLVGVGRSGFVLPFGDGPLISCGPELVPPAVAWQEYYHRLDIGLTQTRRERGLEVFHLLDLYEPDEFVRTELYGDWVHHYGLADALAMVVDVDGALPAASLHCYGDGAESDLRGRGKILLELLLPAFRAGIQALWRYSAYRTCLLDYLDQAPGGTLVVDLNGKVLHQTPALQRLLAHDPEGETLTAVMRDAAYQLAGLVVRRGKAQGGSLLGPVWSTLRTSQGEYRMRTTLFGGPPSGDVPLVLVALEPARRRVLGDLELRERYGLTAREIQVARQLAAGRSSKQIAVDLGISPHTVRRHTEHVYEKLGIQSQAAVGQRLQTDW